MSIPALYNISLYQGDDYQLTFRLREQNSDGTTGNYIDLSGYSAKSQIRHTAADASVLAEFTATVLDQTTTRGGVTLTLTHLQTAALPNTVGTTPLAWDVQVMSGDATPKVTTYLRGAVQVNGEITR